VSRIVVGVGGSATCDGGTGLAQALGVRFRGATTPATGGALQAIRAVDLSLRDPRLASTEIAAACDVTNPLTGPDGAALVYAPQKGATPEQALRLDAGLAHLATLLPGVDAGAPGMGAAGGLGFGLAAFCGARLERGIDLVLELLDFEARVRRADLVLTGEGRLDAQSLQGKACLGVAAVAARHGVPTTALVGETGPGAEHTLGAGRLTAYHALLETCSRDEAMGRTALQLEALAARVVGRCLS
jgi:glycerate kinase